MDNYVQLEDLMLRCALRRRDVAALLRKPLNSAGGYSNSTVDRWLSGKNAIPELALELLELKLADRAEQLDPWQRLIRQPVPYADQRAMEADLKAVLVGLEHGELPSVGRGSKPVALRRAGYWLELIAQLGGPRFKPCRRALLSEARRIRQRVGETGSIEPLRAGDTRPGKTLDDLAVKWGLAPGADISRFRQLAHSGTV